MNKAVKILLIIALIIGVGYGGYWLYQNYFVEKIKEIDSEEGRKLYDKALTKSSGKDFFYVSYNLKENNTTTKGHVTNDSFGYYSEWSKTIDVKNGDDVKTTGGKYAVKVPSSSKYKAFEDDGKNKTSKLITASEYSSSMYAKVTRQENLEFMSNSLESANEDNIKKYYSSVSNVKGEFKHIYGEVESGYVWRTTYKCTFSEGSKKYTSEFIRNVYFDSYITKVTYERVDKELNEEGKVNKKGEKNTFEWTYKIKYETNQAIVKSDFSAYSK